MGRGDARPDLNLRDVERRGEADGLERLRLLTDAGAVECRWHPAPAGDAAVQWVFGAGGGLGGPAGGLYTRLGRQLRSRGIASLELWFSSAVWRREPSGACCLRVPPPEPTGAA